MELERGQGMIEYSLLVVFLAVVVIVILALIWPTTPEGHQAASRREFQHRDAIVQECLASERYTRAECLVLAGGRE